MLLRLLVGAAALHSAAASMAGSPLQAASSGATGGAYPCSASMDTGVVTSCAVGLQTGSVACWGVGCVPSLSVPSLSGQIAVSVANTHACALSSTNLVTCWGNTSSFPTTPTPGVLAVSSGGESTCVILAGTGWLQCWGTNALIQQQYPTSAAFVAISLGGAHGCGILATGGIICFGDNSRGQLIGFPTTGSWAAVSAGWQHTCALPSGAASLPTCWGRNMESQSTLPPSLPPLVAVSAGGYHTLGLDANYMVHCWGDTLSGLCAIPTPLTVSGALSISAGYWGHSCAVAVNTSQVVCWGDASQNLTLVPVSLSAPQVGSCIPSPTSTPTSSSTSTGTPTASLTLSKTSTGTASNTILPSNTTAPTHSGTPSAAVTPPSSVSPTASVPPSLTPTASTTAGASVSASPTPPPLVPVWTQSSPAESCQQVYNSAAAVSATHAGANATFWLRPNPNGAASYLAYCGDQGYTLVMQSSLATQSGDSSYFAYQNSMWTDCSTIHPADTPVQLPTESMKANAFLDLPGSEIHLILSAASFSLVVDFNVPSGFASARSLFNQSTVLSVSLVGVSGSFGVGTLADVVGSLSELESCTLGYNSYIVDAQAYRLGFSCPGLGFSGGIGFPTSSSNSAAGFVCTSSVSPSCSQATSAQLFVGGAAPVSSDTFCVPVPPNPSPTGFPLLIIIVVAVVVPLLLLLLLLLLLYCRCRGGKGGAGANEASPSSASSEPLPGCWSAACPCCCRRQARGRAPAPSPAGETLPLTASNPLLAPENQAVLHAVRVDTALASWQAEQQKNWADQQEAMKRDREAQAERQQAEWLAMQQAQLSQFRRQPSMRFCSCPGTHCACPCHDRLSDLEEELAALGAKLRAKDAELLTSGEAHLSEVMRMMEDTARQQAAARAALQEMDQAQTAARALAQSQAAQASAEAARRVQEEQAANAKRLAEQQAQLQSLMADQVASQANASESAAAAKQQQLMALMEEQAATRLQMAEREGQARAEALEAAHAKVIALMEAAASAASQAHQQAIEALQAQLAAAKMELLQQQQAQTQALAAAQAAAQEELEEARAKAAKRAEEAANAASAAHASEIQREKGLCADLQTQAMRGLEAKQALETDLQTAREQIVFLNAQLDAKTTAKEPAPVASTGGFNVKYQDEVYSEDMKVGGRAMAIPVLWEKAQAKGVSYEIWRRATHNRAGVQTVFPMADKRRHAAAGGPVAAGAPPPPSVGNPLLGHV